ncbi:BrnT family toxin [Desulfonatronum parangueonense]
MYKLAMKFEWDPMKNAANQKKHGISFKKAGALWADPERLEILAPYPLENRHILIGKIDESLWVAIYTMRNATVRIISVRRARKKEKVLYEQVNACHEQ